MAVGDIVTGNGTGVWADDLDGLTGTVRDVVLCAAEPGGRLLIVDFPAAPERHYSGRSYAVAESEVVAGVIASR